MTWTFSDTAVTTDLAKVRLMIGDVLTADQLLSDEIINAQITAAGNNRGAALLCVEFLIAKYSRDVDRSVGDLSVKSGDRLAHFQSLYQTILNRETLAATPFAGGISISDKQVYEDDSDLVTPAFFRTLHDDPGTQASTPSTDDLE